MRLILAVVLQLTALYLAWLDVPIAFIGAGACAAAVIFIRARFTVRED